MGKAGPSLHPDSCDEQGHPSLAPGTLLPACLASGLYLSVAGSLASVTGRMSGWRAEGGSLVVGRGLAAVRWAVAGRRACGGFGADQGLSSESAFQGSGVSAITWCLGRPVKS